jgi:hypothetical protein
MTRRIAPRSMSSASRPTIFRRSRPARSGMTPMPTHRRPCAQLARSSPSKGAGRQCPGRARRKARGSKNHSLSAPAMGWAFQHCRRQPSRRSTAVAGGKIACDLASSSQAMWFAPDRPPISRNSGNLCGTISRDARSDPTEKYCRAT